MLKRNIKLKSIILIALLCIVTFVGVRFIGKGISIKTKGTQPVVISQVKSETVEEDILHKEVIVSKFNTIQKIQVIQTSLTQDITIDNGVENDFFKNKKNLKITGIGKFILDLDKIDEKNIIIDNTNKSIELFITKPYAEVDLQEDKTEFSEEKGLFKFKDIELTLEQSETMKYQVKEQMIEKLNGEGYSEIVEVKTKESIENILNKLTDFKFTVNINFVD